MYGLKLNFDQMLHINSNWQNSQLRCMTMTNGLSDIIQLLTFAEINTRNY